MQDATPTNIRVECSRCGQVRLASVKVTIRCCVDTGKWSYWFTCPNCETRAAGSTSQGRALAAVNAGSPYESWTLPAERNERPAGPPLTLVDLIELRLALIEPDWINQLL
jgi:hypothetical protein